MIDQGSSYSVLRDVPVMVSPHYRLPKQILVDRELVIVPKEMLTQGQYTFSVERQAISNVAMIREKQQLERKARTERLETYKAEKLQQKKVAARKIAPGFLDTDTRILHPQPFRQSKTLLPNDTDLKGHTRRRATVVTGIDEPFKRPSSTSPTPQGQHQLQQQSQQHYPYQRHRSSSTPATDSIHFQEKHQENDQTSFDYNNFEQGLTPLDPWDTPENDMTALRSILTSQATKSEQEISHYYPQQISNSSMTPAYPPPQSNYYPKGSWAYPQYPSPSHSPLPYFAPELPPKIYKDGPTDNINPPTETAPSPARSKQPLPNEYISIRPPLTTNGLDDVLVQELANMGFSHSQASDALKRNENDLTRATNFLLDNS